MKDVINSYLFSSVKIREMESFDLMQVLRIEQDSFTTPWSMTSFIFELTNPLSILLVATLKNIVVGYVCASFVKEKGEIMDLAVMRNYRRKGIGRRLLMEAIHRLRKKGCKEIFLELRASNVAARKLYESMGFKMIGLRKHYYVRPPEDAIVMKLNI